MCPCNVEMVIYRYEDYQMEQCPVCGDCEPEAMDLSADEEAAYDALMESAVEAAGY